MKESTFINIMTTVACAVFMTFTVIGALALVQIQVEIKEQNSILKNLVISTQNQANAIQEQNKILNYNPAEDK